jgi:hypothetical protein
MKSAIFDGTQMVGVSNYVQEGVTAVSVPTLSAYAVEYGEFTPPPNVDTGHRVLHFPSDFTIAGDSLVFSSPLSLLFGGLAPCHLVIHYHGIRDYRLLFPEVEDPGLRGRLALFYEEAEMTFNAGAWLSFALMAGAVYEGLLLWKVGERAESDRISDLIKQAAAENVITEHERRILCVAKENRHLVHAGRYHEPWVGRAGAMDMRAVMDRLIRKFANDRPQ